MNLRKRGWPEYSHFIKQLYQLSIQDYNKSGNKDGCIAKINKSVGKFLSTINEGLLFTPKPFDLKTW